ncbi:hypothetical protein [Azomonas macrocytogenes]|uniref:Uncharacterized protein n=1 Tax=Azomonas macrocytogenes TaxID=69962 RepID=A0A839T4D8_AZOMA|nr:hypothetical protein [Azomonas macrocytogenes]MBB3103948.1 hypothetical protein [Azomonas macrocytogenes]
MNDSSKRKTHKPSEKEKKNLERKPEKDTEDQLDKALEDTFPASDPISP